MRLFLRRVLEPEYRVRWSPVAAAIGVAAVLLGLQYTPYALFSSEKNDTLWGVLTGMVVFTLVLLIGRRIAAGRAVGRR